MTEYNHVFRHVMIDLETLGTKADSVICQIGAVEFEPDSGELGRRLNIAVDWCNQPERIIYADTVLWWLQQGEDAREQLLSDAALGTPLYHALDRLRSWMPPDCIVWGNGAIFDIVILEHAFAQLKVYHPWNHWQVRDCRTIEDAAQDLVTRDEVPREGTHHDALDDAVYQATYISRMWQELRP